jgi:DNA-binding transcriptional LysR family regulator
VRKINNLDISLIRTFVTIVNNKGYAQASQILNLTESAVSHQMKRLEEQIGALLFQRKGRIKELTPIGEVFLGYASQILALNDELYNRVADLSQVNEIVHFGLPEYFADHILHKLLSEFSKIFPNIDFRTRVKGNYSLWKDIENESLDFAIVIGNNNARYSNTLSMEQLVWVGDKVNVDHDTPLPLISFEAPCPFRNAMIEVLNKNNIIWNITYTARNLSDMRAALKANLGVSALPKMVADIPLLINTKHDLPNLPELEVRLLFPQQTTTKTIHKLSDIIFYLW